MERLTDELKNIGVDVDHVIAMLGGNDEIYLNICRKFLKDTNFSLFLASMEANDMNMAGIYIHTLKGVAANLGFIKMSLLCSSILEDIKNNDFLFIHKKLQELTDENNRINELLMKEKA